MDDEMTDYYNSGDDSEKKKGVKLFRIPIFKEDECMALLRLVEENSQILLSPTRTAEVCKQKEDVWAAIANDYNSRGFITHRSAYHLRVKWENLKKIARKKLMEGREDASDNVHGKAMHLLLHSAEVSDSVKSSRSGDNDQHPNEQLPSKRVRSTTFTPAESNVLLQCVKDESNYLFPSDKEFISPEDKRQAWDRIEKCYNAKMPEQKRTAKVLKTKFENMKSVSKIKFSKGNIGQVRVKRERDDTTQSAQVFELRETEDILSPSTSYQDPACDPLSSVLNGFTYTGFESSGSASGVCIKEDPEVVRLKLQILNYQLETAKMERQRVHEAMEAERVERLKRNELLELQLKEARLSMEVTEQKLGQNIHSYNCHGIPNAHFNVP